MTINLQVARRAQRVGGGALTATGPSSQAPPPPARVPVLLCEGQSLGPHDMVDQESLKNKGLPASAVGLSTCGPLQWGLVEALPPHDV